MPTTATTHNSKPTIEPEAVSEREAAAFLNLSPRAFRNVMTRGDITPIKDSWRAATGLQCPRAARSAGFVGAAAVRIVSEARWRRIVSVEWYENPLRGMTDEERVVYFYAKTGPQSTSIGIFRISTALAVEELGNLTPVEFDYRLDRVCKACDWRFDPSTRVLWIPRWVHDNPPQSPNVCVAWRKLLSNLPDCNLKFEAAAAIQQYLKDLPQAFREAFGSLPKDIRKSKAKAQSQSEANQEAGDQGIRGSGDQGAREQARAGERKNGPSSTNTASGELPAHLVAAARQTLKLTNPNRPLEELVDAFKITVRQNGGGDCSTSDAHKVLNVALAERSVQ